MHSRLASSSAKGQHAKQACTNKHAACRADIHSTVRRAAMHSMQSAPYTAKHAEQAYTAKHAEQACRAQHAEHSTACKMHTTVAAGMAKAATSMA